VSSAVPIVLAAIPSPDRGVWYLGPIPIRAYALCIIAGIVVAVLWGERRFVARGGEPGTVTDVAVFAVPFGLVGGRLYHVITDWQTYFGPSGNPIDALKIWQGGLGIWGAIALGAVGAWIGCRRRGVPLPFFADAVAPGVVTAQAIGRLGNWFNQELYGGPTTLPWGLEIYRRVDPETGVPDSLGGVALDRTPIEIVHPTFLYELLWNLLVAGLVVWADRRFRLGHGRAFAVYVAGYTAGRFWIEQMRTDYATRVFGDLRINVVVSALVFLGAVAYLLLVRKPREVLASPSEGGTTPADDQDPEDDEPVSVGAGAARPAADGPAAPAKGRRVPEGGHAGRIAEAPAPEGESAVETAESEDSATPDPAPVAADAGVVALAGSAAVAAGEPAVDERATDLAEPPSTPAHDGRQLADGAAPGDDSVASEPEPVTAGRTDGRGPAATGQVAPSVDPGASFDPTSTNDEVASGDVASADEAATAGEAVPTDHAASPRDATSAGDAAATSDAAASGAPDPSGEPDEGGSASARSTVRPASPDSPRADDTTAVADPAPVSRGSSASARRGPDAPHDEPPAPAAS
jgi:prolipoprotein diacylglyceryl transferase